MHTHVDWLWTSAATLWPTMGGALGAFAVGAAGAYFGSLGAQRSINALDVQRRRSEAISLANSAQSLAHVIANQALVLKVRHFEPTLTAYKAQQADVMARLEAGQKEDLNVIVDIQNLPPVAMPIDKLQTMIFGKIPLNGQALGALAQLGQADHTLKELSVAHGDLFREIRGSEHGPLMYLGIHTQLGADRRYEDLITGLVDVADDFFVFSDMLQSELLEYARQIRAKAPVSQRKKLPSVNIMGQVLPEFRKHLPDPRNYSGWTSGYVVQREEPKKGFLNKLLRR